MNSNKSLKDAYKQMKFTVGVFQIRNCINGKVLIGSSVNLGAVWNRHKMELAFGGHRNEALQEEWKQYGEENFVFEVLAEIKQTENEQTDYNKEAKKLEQMFIEERQPFGANGYNKTGLR